MSRFSDVQTEKESRAKATDTLQKRRTSCFVPQVLSGSFHVLCLNVHAQMLVQEIHDFCKWLFHKKGDNVDLNGTMKSHLISKKSPRCIPMSEVRVKFGKVVCKVLSQFSHTNLKSATHPTEVAVHHNRKKENCSGYAFSTKRNHNEE